MADITKTILKMNTTAVLPTGTALSTSGVQIAYDKADQKILILLTNSGSSAASGALKAGNGIQGTNDLSFSIEAGKTLLLVAESGKFVNHSGENKGKAVLTGTSDIKAACVALP